MTIDEHATIGMLVTQRLGRAAVFEVHDVDYCCGGHRTLASLAADGEIDLDSLIHDLEMADEAADEPAPEWAELSPAELADHIEATHHPFVRGAIERIEALLAKVLSVHGEAHPELTRVDVLFRAIAADMGPHLAKEEQVLFPLVHEMVGATSAPNFHCGTLANPINVMAMEHDMVGDHLRQLRETTDGYTVPPDGCDSYRALYAALEEFEADTHLHVHKENNVLFPAVLAQEAELTARWGRES
jgi:regulator of cell morphogenesis and NO signaling